MDLPPRPDESDCCNSGCNPCILDVYEELLLKYKKGTLTKNKESLNNCIGITTYSVFKLIKVIQHTHNTVLFTFEYINQLRSKNTEKSGLMLHYKPGQYFLIKGNSLWDKTEEFTRAYTPLPYYDESENNLSFTVLVKFYDGGEMSQYLRRLKLEDTTLWRGPYGEFEISYSYNNILFIAQGVGIAPIFAVLKAMIDNDNCETFLTLYFCCRSVKDILLRDKLYELSSYWNFKYEVFLSTPDKLESKYNEILHLKHLKKDDIEKYMRDKAGKTTQIIICGSSNFEEAMKEQSISCGVKEKDIFLF